MQTKIRRWTAVVEVYVCTVENQHKSLPTYSISEISKSNGICHRIESKRILFIAWHPDKSTRTLRPYKLASEKNNTIHIHIYFEILFVLPTLRHHKITVHELRRNINTAQLLLIGFPQGEKKKTRNGAAEAHIRSMLLGNVFFKFQGLKKSVIFARLLILEFKECCHFLSSFPV